MSWRFFSVLLGLSAAGLFSGCATGPRTAGVEADTQLDAIQGPSTLIAGARVDEVRSLAMGAARSKGWTIISATDQKLVLRRPVNTDSPQAVELGLTAGGTPPEIEVKTYFLQRSDGVNVVANAQLLTQNQGKGAGEQRTDYTETYRDSLMRSLASLRNTWTTHHSRVAHGLPPVSQQGAAAAETAAELNEQRSGTPSGAPQQSPLPQTTPTAWGEAETEPAATTVQERSYPRAEPAPVPAPAARPVAAPAPAKTPVATATAAKPATTKPTTPPAKATPGAVAAKPVAAAAKPVPTSTTAAKPAPKAAPAPSPAPSSTPPQGSSQIAKAESVAQSRGCKVRPGRTIVHKRDADADFLRVYCVGDPPFLIKCGGGRCKVIE